MNRDQNKKHNMREYRGIGASPGIAIGQAFIFNEAIFWVEEKDIPPEQIDREKARFKAAVEEVIGDIRDLKSKIEKKVGKEDASIFDPHIMLLEDPTVIQETHDIIAKGKNAEYAFFKTTRKIIKVYQKLEDPYLRQRADDITDILRRVYTKLKGKEFSVFSTLQHPVIVVAPNLSPSDTAHMHTGSVLAFVTDLGGLTSHATILARSLGIPAVLGVKNASMGISHGEYLIVDGIQGKVIVDPDEKTLEEYHRKKRELEEIRESLHQLRDLPSVTVDGKHIGLHANIEFPDEVDAVIDNGAAGIGLYRTEYHFLEQDRMPTEEELYADYSKIARALVPRSVNIRTFDLGGDKISHLVQTQPEENPFLGWRAIRVSLAHKDIFKVHLKAIIRASATRNVKVMFPMISSMEELNEALVCVEDVKDLLRREGRDFDENIPVGVMIEVPSAVMIAGHLAAKADFLSIGTNDLIQYSVAVDRTNDRIANLFEPFHPGVLRMIQMTVEAGHAHGIPVAVCGEVSNDPVASLILIGLGIDELSMAPTYIPTIKNMVRRVSFVEAQRLAQLVLNMSTAQETKQYIEKYVEKFTL
ncbi:phosphoenolpyruvate--protein phosphotransferase [Candidatus Latescibacterota bacterium]